MKKSEPAPAQVVSRAAFAKLISRSKARVSQLCKAGEMPGVQADGRIDAAVALKWLERNHSPHGGGWGSRLRRNDVERITVRGARLAPAAPKLKAVPNRKPRQSAPNAPEAIDERLADAEHAGYIRALTEITSGREQARFARVALRADCTPEQAYQLALWHASQATLALTTLEPEEIENTPEPDWVKTLGKAIDFDTVDVAYDRLTDPDTGPSGSEESLSHEAGLDALCSLGPDERPAA